MKSSPGVRQIREGYSGISQSQCVLLIVGVVLTDKGINQDNFNGAIPGIEAAGIVILALAFSAATVHNL